MRLRWYQFTLRRLLLLVLLVSLPLAWLGRQGLRHLQRRRAATEIVALGGRVYWETEILENIWYGDDLVYVDMVDLRSASFPTPALVLLQELPGLRNVGLFSPQFDDASLDALTGLRDLDFLKLGSRSFTDNGLSKLKLFPGLRYLNLIGPQFTDSGVGHVRAMPQVNYLWLDNVNMTAAGMQQLRHCQALHSLTVTGPWFTGTCLDGLAGAERLKWLHIENSSVQAGDLEGLQSLPALAALSLVGPSIGDGDLRAVRKLPALRTLHLSGTGLTNAGLADLRGANIAELNLSDGQFDDDCLAILEALPLRRFICQQTRITEEAIARLKRAKPELQVVVPERQ